LFHAVWRDVKEGQSNADVARKFMNTLTLLLVKTVEQARQKTGIKKVVLSGGVFQNRILLADCERRLRGAGFDCFSQQRVPSNDGGLALGQLCIGAAHFKRES
jgi:hydrogenase maturation protein HypF